MAENAAFRGRKRPIHFHAGVLRGPAPTLLASDDPPDNNPYRALKEEAFCAGAQKLIGILKPALLPRVEPCYVMCHECLVLIILEGQMADTGRELKSDLLVAESVTDIH